MTDVILIEYVASLIYEIGESKEANAGEIHNKKEEKEEETMRWN